MLLIILIAQFLFPQTAHADLEGLQFIQQQRAAQAAQSESSDKLSGDNDNDNADDEIEDVMDKQAERLKYCSHGHIKRIFERCELSFLKAQAALGSASEFAKAAGRIKACDRACVNPDLSELKNCENGTREKAQQRLAVYMNKKHCNVATNITDGETSFKVFRIQQTDGDKGVQVSSVSQPDGDGYRGISTCIEDRKSLGQPGVCQIKTGVSTGSPGETSYVFTDANGNQFSTRAEAATSNATIQQGATFFNGNGRSEVVTTAPIPLERPANLGVAPGVTSVSKSGAGGVNGGSNNGGVNGTNSSPAVESANKNYVTPTANQTNDDPLVNENNGNGSVANNTGGNTYGSSSSSFGDPSMFPGLQSAKVSSSGNGEVTSASAKTLGYPTGSSSPRGSSSGSYKSYAGGVGGTAPNLNGGSSEVASSAPRSLASTGAISSGGGGISGGGSSSPGGLQVASVNPSAQSTGNIRIGDQEFYKPGGSAIGGGSARNLALSSGGKATKGSKRLKSVGGCAPGNIQCVLGAIGGPGALSSRVKGKRFPASLTHGDQSRLPAGVTGGIEDIFARVVRFHNQRINLDHEGMIESSDGGFGMDPTK